MSASTNWEDVYRVQTARIAELERENAALRKDKARLDYIFYPSCSMRARARMRKFIGTQEYLPGTGLCAWRAGIDDAMGEGKQ